MISYVQKKNQLQNHSGIYNNKNDMLANSALVLAQTWGEGGSVLQRGSNSSKRLFFPSPRILQAPIWNLVPDHL